MANSSTKQRIGTAPKLDSGIAEYFYTLRDRVLVSLPGTAGRGCVVAVTGCHSGPGVTTVAANFAVALSQARKGQVLLCDANVDSGAARGILGVPRGGGLAEIVGGERQLGDAVLGTGTPTLDVLQAGNQRMNLSDLLQSSRFEGVMNEIRDRYVYTVLDTPPVLDCSATARLATAADGVVLVIEAERERWEVAQRATALLTQAGARVLGAVLNKREFHIPGFLYQRL